MGHVCNRGATPSPFPALRADLTHADAGASALCHAMELHEVIVQQRTQDTVLPLHLAFTIDILRVSHRRVLSDAGVGAPLHAAAAVQCQLSGASRKHLQVRRADTLWQPLRFLRCKLPHHARLTVCRVLHRCTSSKHAAVYVVTLPPLPPDPPTSIESKVGQSQRSQSEQGMENDLSRQYWESYNLARTVHGVAADAQPKASARAAYVQIDAIDYAHVAQIDPDFKEPPPVVLGNGVVLKAAPKLRRYPAGTRLSAALAHSGMTPSSASPSLVTPYTWDGVSWACHNRDATIVMYNPAAALDSRISVSLMLVIRYTLTSPPVGSSAPLSSAGDDRLMAIELPLGMEGGGRGGLAAFVAATGQTLLTTNASSHHAYSPFPFTQSARSAPASMMLVPVFLQGWDGSSGSGRIVMVMEVGDKVDGGSYSRDDLALLSRMGRSVSSVLEHVEANERSVSQATHLLSSSGTAICCAADASHRNTLPARSSLVAQACFRFSAASLR